MKTVTVTAEQPELRKLVEEAHNGADVVLACGEKKVRLEPYLPMPRDAEIDLEADTPELEAELLKAIKGPFTPYSRQDLEAIAERVRRENAT
jgi:hypothetical protein